MSKILTECEFELRLVNYDLLGREATAAKNFIFNPLPESIWFDQNGISSLKSLLDRNTLIFIIIIASVIIIILLIIVFTIIKTITIWRWKKISSLSTESCYTNGEDSIRSFEKLSTHTIVDV